MAEDILEKGAIIQRDKESYAVAPHIPGGIITDFDLLRRLADVAEKYGVKAMKLTSAQRIALVGLKPEDLDPVWQELGMVPGAAIGLCVRSIKICPGTTFCRIGMQDAVGVGLHLDEKYHGMPLPFKFKIGVSGCPRCCGESRVRDVGIMGSAKGWTVFFGGHSGFSARQGVEVATGLSSEETLACVRKLLGHFSSHAEPKERTSRFLERVGTDWLKQERSP